MTGKWGKNLVDFKGNCEGRARVTIPARFIGHERVMEDEEGEGGTEGKQGRRRM